MKKDHVNMDEDFEDIDDENNDQGDEIEVKSSAGNHQAEAGEKTAEKKEAPVEELPRANPEVERLENEVADLKDRYLRLAAEFDNYKKRMARDFSNIVETANQDLIKSLLDILDNFRRALAINYESDSESILKGMELIFSQLDNLLKERGLEEIDALGKPFNPEVHDAVMTLETDEYPEGHVADEFQKGYRLKGRIIRHSKVAVAKPKSQ